jgi:hypothetical protein
MEALYQIAGIVHLLVTLGLLFLAGQGVLYVLAGHKRATNLFYQLFQVLTRPVIRLTRAITPKVIIDRHVPFVAFLLLVWIWLVLALMVLPDLACQLGRIECPAARKAG